MIVSVLSIKNKSYGEIQRVLSVIEKVSSAII
jgi:hypothetical protein